MPEFEFFRYGYLNPQKLCNLEIDAIVYNCVEQYMMAEKARLFGDQETLNRIMNIANPKTQKQLGRLVTNFVPQVWSAMCYDISYKGNLEKCKQNDMIKSFLLGTGNKVLVFVSNDNIWGIGVGANERNIHHWSGLNKLGKILMAVRDTLRSQMIHPPPNNRRLFVGKTCAICLDDFDLDNDVITALTCGHVFHEDCSSRTNICAICRK